MDDFRRYLFCLFRKMWIVALLLIGLASASAQDVSRVEVQGVRMWSSPEGTRVVFDVSGFLQHSIFVLKNPDRVVIDFEKTSARSDFSNLDLSNSILSGIRSAKRDDQDLRVVLDLKQRSIPKAFLLNPTQRYGHRLVVDLETTEPFTSASVKPQQPAIIFDQYAPRAIVVAIDAGHGGEDPGAIGKHGTREKDVVLQIAKQLESLIVAEWGMRPVLIRGGDYYISLRERIHRARTHKADLFVSIHADAFHRRSASGASVYVLSERGASSEAARWLANSENASDLVGGVSLDDKDNLLASVLLDLSQNATIAASMEIGGTVLKELERVGPVHRPQVEQAGFVVLKSPDVPSLLIETGFISNLQEERKLGDKQYQHQIARAILKGVRRYFRDNPPPGTLLAQAKGKRHIISSGDTLHSIAQRYAVSTTSLRTANALNGDVISIGQVLIIPSQDEI